MDKLAEEYLKGEESKEQENRRKRVEYKSDLESQQVKMSVVRQAGEKRNEIEANRNAIFVNTKRDMVVKRKAKEKEFVG